MEAINFSTVKPCMLLVGEGCTRGYFVLAVSQFFIKLKEESTGSIYIVKETPFNECKFMLKRKM